MKSIILAAGIGSRLNLSKPKGLLRLPNNETLLARQVRIQKSFGLNNINIVVGHKNELIEKQITDVNYIHNPDYTDTNTSKSLLLGLADIDDDVIWSNGDLIYDENIIGEIIKSESNTVIVNKARCGEEEVKHSINGSGQIIEISKEDSKPEGETLGINLIRREALADSKKALEECGKNDYFERGLQILINRKTKILPLDVSQYRCIEIDFPEDWKKAQKMFAN
ncbi:MAG TPA: phosphocholine cytidylyltransferase family protein [candidate division Zixibacteria bacterium]|nr:phosphocholine cytidylyltransferase family protein [candidate division Zixibacteria bacterium]